MLLKLAVLALTAAAAGPRADCDRYLTDLHVRLVGDVGLRFRSDQRLTIDRAQLSAHLPSAHFSRATDPHVITHVHNEEVNVEARGPSLRVAAPWRDGTPVDLPHLMYGVARRAWLKRGLFPVHAACVGDDRRGYVLLVGPSGAGKTSIALDAVAHGFKLFSGDKTIVRVTKAGGLEAIAGTKLLTVRPEDEWRWRDVPKVDAKSRGGRLTFALKKEAYARAHRVPIRAVMMVRVNDGVETVEEVAPGAALHALYPIFTDKQREDVLIGGEHALFDGGVSPRRRQRLIRALTRALKTTPVARVSGSVDVTRAAIGRALGVPRARARKRVLLGICGIGNGHLNRQRPVLEHLLAGGDEVLVFAYGESLAQLRANPRPNLTVIEVANPYFVGTPEGLDFGATARADVNRVDFLKINAGAIDRARREFGRPDLVISDYEMVSAQLAYAYDVPLVTLDQQSKFLNDAVPTELEGTSARDEVERLNMFFPRARRRLVASFFRLPPGRGHVTILPPMIRDEVRARENAPLSPRPSVYVYISAQRFGVDAPEDAFVRMAPQLPRGFDFHVHWPRRRPLPADQPNVYYHHHGTPGFDDRLAAAHAVITTAGHTLISEAMFLRKPVLAMPLPLFEQNLNARVIEANGFGLSRAVPTLADVTAFLSRVPEFSARIRGDDRVLFRDAGNAMVIDAIERELER